jgi:hypothetical protein
MMTNDQLFPTSWETQKVLLKDFYGFGKTELAVVFSSRLKQYKDNLSEDGSALYTENKSDSTW